MRVDQPITPTYIPQNNQPPQGGNQGVHGEGQNVQGEQHVEGNQHVEGEHHGEQHVEGEHHGEQHGPELLAEPTISYTGGAQSDVRLGLNLGVEGHSRFGHYQLYGSPALSLGAHGPTLNLGIGGHLEKVFGGSHGSEQGFLLGAGFHSGFDIPLTSSHSSGHGAVSGSHGGSHGSSSFLDSIHNDFTLNTGYQFQFDNGGKLKFTQGAGVEGSGGHGYHGYLQTGAEYETGAFTFSAGARYGDVPTTFTAGVGINIGKLFGD